MKTALHEEERTIRIVDLPIPQPGPGEAVMKIKLYGICGTDLRIHHEGADLVEKGLERLAVDRSLVKIAVAP